MLPLCPRQVLSGDPKQLGPIVRSPLASTLGLGRSLQEHLMTLPSADTIYTADGDRGAVGGQPVRTRRKRRRCITTLRRNYRCGRHGPATGSRESDDSPELRHR